MDPIHGFINITEYPVIEELVESKYFQRLRRLAQLGLTSAVYPNATHTRFAHSLGVMHTFTILFDSIMRRETIVKDQNEKRMIGSVTALLHDLGHGPFSHASENILDNGDFDHLDMTCDIISKSEISDILKKYSIDTQLICDILHHQVSKEWILVSQLVSSQLDADRLDYLVRDAYFTGVQYGQADVHRIANTLTIWHGKDNDPFNETAVVKLKGKNAIEDYILGRHLMYKGVYYHKISRGMELLLVNLFKRASKLEDKITNLSKIIDINSKTTPELLYNMDDNAWVALFHEWTNSSDSVLQDISKRILERGRLASIHIPSQKYLKLDFGKEEKIAQIVDKAGFPPEYYLAKDTEIKSPYKEYNTEELEDGNFSPTEHIMICTSDTKLQEVSRLSAVIDTLSKTQVDEVTLFLPEEVLPEVNQIVNG